MSNLSSYQPFLIGEGQSKTGFFTYLQSWIKPQDAYDELLDAYVYRGIVNKRNGSTLYPSTAGSGSMVYANSQIVGRNTSGAPVAAYAYNSTNGVVIPNLDIIAGSAIFRVMTSAGLETFTDDGVGGLTGDLGDSGTINYTNGQWSLTLGGGRTIANNVYIWAEWNFAAKYTTAGGGFSRPIMAIATYINESNNSQVTVVCDTRRLCWYNSSTPVFVPVNTVVNDILGNGDGVSNPQTFTSQWIPLAGYTITISDGVNSITDNGDGTLTAAGNMIGPNTINYTTGAISLALTAANTRTYRISSTLAGDYFTGDYTNFFNWTNWKPTSGSTAYLYLTNNVDRITLFDGTNLSRPPFFTVFANIATNTNDVAKALDVKVYKNSLLVIRPTLVGASAPEAQSIRSSKPFDPTNLASNVAGNGTNTVSPTGDWIMAAEFLRDVLVIFFLKSTWIFRYTGSAFEPFRFDQVNSSRNTNAPYGSESYDLMCTSCGLKGLIYCDGNNVNRYDESIIDQFLEIEPRAFNQTYSQKFDTLNQTWILYPSTEDAPAASTQSTSSRILVYNFLENNWAIYRLALSCLGLGTTVTDLRWQDFAPSSGSVAENKTWEEWDYSWVSYQNFSQMPSLLGGGNDGYIYELDVGETDNGTDITTSIVTKRMNPFVSTGQKATFGYLDVYYSVAPEVTLTFNFAVNNAGSPQLTKTMNLTTIDATTNTEYAWQRIYINIVGEFLQIQITDNGASQFQILGMILHAAPAGRLTPGSFV